MPPLWANAESPTYGWDDHGLRLASSETKRDTSRSSRSCSRGMHSSPIFSMRFGMIETRLALPQRSP